ncbi:hypothetical protein [Paracoccus sp. DMF]|uniref:hypothetical protein n=1 Tax=Paracoccus sp. DMF TaxID=400837 RepID=UPI001101C88D|nr:hypothetical protein [Paracoccus sp. DMF]MCV2449004.1 hypothetical protein [Paracoccus sp. DMF]
MRRPTPPICRTRNGPACNEALKRRARSTSFRAAVEKAISSIRPGTGDHFIWIAGEAADRAAFVPSLDPIRKARRMDGPYWLSPVKSRPSR